MPSWYWLLILFAAWPVAVALNRWSVRRHDQEGDPREGILIFIEPVRWLFIIWGFRQFCTGLRRAGWRGQTRLLRWSTTAGALLVVPDVVRRSRLRRWLRDLARQIERLAVSHPAVSIHLCGYSTGCYIALEALRRTRGAAVDKVLLLAGTTSPGYPLVGLSATTKRVYHVYSPIDLINLIGPLLVGTNDRRWTPACGSIGFRASRRSVVQRRWHWRDLASLYFGDHFSIVSPRFVCRRLAPLLCRTSKPASR